jgi:hypothetical protein
MSMNQSINVTNQPTIPSYCINITVKLDEDNHTIFHIWGAYSSEGGTYG